MKTTPPLSPPLPPLGDTANLILIGPMGAGKTTIGRRLARQLGREFVDSDSEIERRTGVNIPTIFEFEGESGFRAREQKVIAELCRRRGAVIATGGGAVVNPDNRRHLSASGIVIYLQTSVDEQLRRIRNDGSRPLLRAADPRRRLGELLTVRDPLYRQTAHLIVDTGNGQVGQIVRRILARLRRVSPPAAPTAAAPP